MSWSYWTLALVCFVACAVDAESTVEMFVQNADNELTIDMKRGIVSGISLMAAASQSIFGWCRTVKSLLIAQVVGKSTAHSQLMKIIDDGNEMTKLAQIELRMSRLVFNTITAKLILLKQQFEKEIQKEHVESETNPNAIADFKEKLTSTGKFYENLKTKADEMFMDISELKADIDKIEMNAASGEDLGQYSELTESLIAKCHEIVNA